MIYYPHWYRRRGGVLASRCPKGKNAIKYINGRKMRTMINNGRQYRNNMVKYVSESSQCLRVYGGWTVLPCGKAGDNMVTFEALTCMYTLGLLIVAIIALKQGK